MTNAADPNTSLSLVQLVTNKWWTFLVRGLIALALAVFVFAVAGAH